MRGPRRGAERPGRAGGRALTTLLYSHPDCLAHDTGYGHPESADRLRAVLARLDGPEFAGLERRVAPLATWRQLSRVHDAAYVAKVFDRVPKAGEAEVAPDVPVSPGSGQAALRAAGAVVAAVDAVAAGEARNAFCAVRPPGHHSGPRSTMGFCLFNNVAVGVEQARERGFQRIAVIDFDVHHGNGTQAIYRSDPTIRFTSIHQTMIFPRTGDSGETGVGNLINVPLLRGTGGPAFLAALRDRIIAPLRDFGPDFLLISAGFDAHVRDPLGDLKLRTADFAEITRDLLELAESCCGGRLVSVMEGGYNPEAQADSCAAHVTELMRH